MIDKRVDASTRRMLARRDVEKFEQTCGSIDPDATAAFKSLLAIEKPAVVAAPAAPAAPAPVAAPAARIAEAPAREAVRKADPHPQTAAKMLATAWPGAERREPGVSDTQWLDAVRQALLTKEAHRTTPDAVEAPIAPRLRLIPQDAAAPVQTPAAVPAVPPLAPALPPPAQVAAPAAVVAAPAAPRTDAGHPVPPAAIPDPAEAAAAQANEPHSRVRRWIAKIPLMGNVIDNGLQ